MTKGETSSRNRKTKHGSKKQHPKKKKNQSGKEKGGRRNPPTSSGETIVFDEQARAAFLQGFSSRKRERRLYGLALQRVKDRKAHLEQKAERAKLEKEQIEQAEQEKQERLESALLDSQEQENPLVLDEDGFVVQKHQQQEEEEEESKDEIDEHDDREKKIAAAVDPVEKVETYQDLHTQSLWGGQVIVTTSASIPGDDDDVNSDNHNSNNGNNKKEGNHSVDAEQEYAGNVEKYLQQLRAQMPSKKKGSKKNQQQRPHKGQHGASTMKGMAGGSDWKVVQKALAKSKAAAASSSTKHRSGGGVSTKKRRR